MPPDPAEVGAVAKRTVDHYRYAAIGRGRNYALRRLRLQWRVVHLNEIQFPGPDQPLHFVKTAAARYRNADHCCPITQA